MKFNESILKLRKGMGFTQEELAEKLDVSRQTISNWETGSVQPTIDKAIELANLYGISIDELVGNSTVKTIKKSKILERLISKKVTLHIDPEKAFELIDVGKTSVECTIIDVNPVSVRVLIEDKKESYERLFFLKDVISFEYEVI